MEWAEYSWKKPVTATGSRVYWFDDTGRGACRLPASWQIEYLDVGGQWKPVRAKSTYDVAKDRWCEIGFEPITTVGLRLIVQMKPDWAAGVHEWKVVELDSD
jgi:hypothetical protein